MTTNPRKTQKQERDSREVQWNDLRPTSTKHKELATTSFVAPLGSLKGIDHLEGRIAEIQRLVDAQARDAAINRVLIEESNELPSIVDEFRANGFKAVSLSSSLRKENDDDDAEVSEQRLGHVAMAHITADGDVLDVEEMAARQRRIEWEREQSLCSPVVIVGLIPDENSTNGLGATVQQDWMMRFIKVETMQKMGKRAKDACPHKSWDEVQHARALASYYGVGSGRLGVWTGPQYPEQSLDELGAEDLMKPETNGQGEQELGLHGGTEDSPVAEERPDGSLWLAMDAPIRHDTTRDTEDPMSFNSLLWEEAENGLELAIA
jgi:hypothetical protein